MTKCSMMGQNVAGYFKIIKNDLRIPYACYSELPD